MREDSSASALTLPIILSRKNVIVISAEDRLRSGRQPGGKQSARYESYGCFYTRTTGIWQTVYLECVPVSYISKIKIYPHAESCAVSVVANIEGRPAGKIIAEAFFEGRPVGRAEGYVSNKMAFVNIKLSEKHLWEIRNGRLYDLKITCGEDEVLSYFGLRDIKIENETLILNGKKVFQRLVLDQGYYPDGILTAPSEEALIADIKYSLDFGFDGARLHQKVFEPLFLYHCDRLGYIVWGEHGNWGLDIRGDLGWQGYVSEWSEIVERDMSHPSIIGWCPFNETVISQNNEFVKSIVQLTKTLDPTRPVIDSSGWVHVEKISDFTDWHDYDQNPETFRQRYIGVANGVPIKNSKWFVGELFPKFISEYGGIKWDVSGVSKGWGYGDAPKSGEEFLERFKGLTEALLFNPFMTGLCYTQLTDVEQEVNGLLTFDRKHKFPAEFFKKVLSQKAAAEE